MTATNTYIVQQLRTSREAAFEQLYEASFPQVARMVKAMGGEYEDARDIFQDALVILYEKAVEGRLDIQSSPSAYLMGIAKHLWLRQRRQNSHLLALSELEQQIDIPEDFFQQPEKPSLRLFRFLAAAGRKCMEILQAFYYQRMPLPEIAEEFGFANTRSATVQKHKCLEKVREQVKAKTILYEEVVE
ncbi:MAG: sigma-70 family RNA polymerase sigma factor [Lewinellaceae bacterium]|nr:sigma-70 family RNA polymerase sigma factor [Phaeodactylibacter sp.]MCB0612447.1 sigma-70 family RNA polymerase sigma factor [Phaeodactylibacter sp.]MCB9347255.1 sigma-70 family RNA polymerase sigma factor [Lewinellaceae bacterium]